jgi:formyl-CoA transferase
MAKRTTSATRTNSKSKTASKKKGAAVSAVKTKKNAAKPAPRPSAKTSVSRPAPKSASGRAAAKSVPTKTIANNKLKPAATKPPTKPAAKSGTSSMIGEMAVAAVRAAATSPMAKRMAGELADAAMARGLEAAGDFANSVMDKMTGKVRGKGGSSARAQQNGSGLPEPSTAPWGQAGRALDGVRILDFTHVQSGPTCTQLLAWLGADVIKIERPGVGDITRGQLRDVPNVDSLYFTMLNHNKRSITVDSKHPRGKALIEDLIKKCDVLVENFAPGALDRMGFTFEHINKLNPRMVVASVKGFGPGPYEDCKVYENVAQCTGGSASTTGFRDGPPLVTGAQIGDSGTGLHLALGIVSALYQRQRTGRGQKVLCAMQDGVLNLARVKLRDQQRLAHGPLTEYAQYGEGIPFGDAVPRSGNDSGGGQPGWILKCKGWETDPNAYIYFITQAPVWGAICDLIGKPEWKTDADYATPKARLPKLKAIFATIEEWTMTKSKFEVMETCNEHDIPVGPILSMKEIAEEPSLRKTGTVVEVDHPTRGKYLTVGNPIKMSDSISEVKRSPLLGEHTDEILTAVLGYQGEELETIKTSGALTAPDKPAKAEAA